MSFSGHILKLFGWTVNVTVPDYPKCLICVAPHTSNWDFILGKLAYKSIGRQAGFLMKSSWFFPPLGWIFKAMGGIPVVRHKTNNTPSLTEYLVNLFNTRDHLAIAITPEGTRSLTHNWHTGFLHIARQANIPILIGIIDYRKKNIDISQVFYPTGDTEQDLKQIKKYYKGSVGRFPDKFSTD